ncbi:hypothetical protein BEP19_16650 [Ammoniphilus oxalaticus]|uniref:histidine kinase n=2 Tax=Ammoniphilus oxalaticus TaxID=66863 RepID=A0A419SQR9_9BACL|nr:hypothetical protein BEP19_16650 [Ammoniphilus oxalaticus]
MGIALVAIWTISALLIVTDPKNPSSRWAAVMAFVGGFGFLAGSLNEEIRPLLNEAVLGSPVFQSWLNERMIEAASVASLICQVGLPYTYLMFALYSGEQLKPIWRFRWGLLLLLPVVYTIWISPVIPSLQLDYPRLVLWVIPYMLLAAALLVKQMWLEKDPILRRSRFFVIILAVFPNLIVLFTIYLARLFGDFDAWKYNLALILALFIFFVGFALKYGVLGVRLRVEQNRVRSTLRALTSGTSILNHTLKNEVGKIQLLAYRIERIAAQHQLKEMEGDLAQLQAASDHILLMAERIHDKTQEIKLNETEFLLSEIVQAAINHIDPLAKANPGVHIELSLGVDGQLTADKVHLTEVLVNLLQNAMEAMDGDGRVQARSYLSKRYVVVAVEDTGKGIAKENIASIFDPFFSTKKSQQLNFGLGLAYCFQVMREHQGRIEMESKLGEGTSFFLYIPRRRFHELKEGAKMNE